MDTASNDSGHVLSVPDRWVVIGALFGFAPLIYWHIAGLLQKPHYQFLYLLPIAIWLLTLTSETDNSSEILNSRRRPETIGLLSAIIGIAGLFLASYLWSPWIASVAFLLAVPGLLIFNGGWMAFKRFFPTWVFLWVLVPLPFGIDEDLIVRLRGVTTRGASAVLDQIGILHDSYANIIQLPGKPLFIADACSGIHSLYVLLAAALLIVTLLRRGIIHSILLLASTFVLVIAENITRITSVAVLWERGYDYSVGTNHELLGATLFVVSLLLILSLDQLLVFILPSRITPFFQWIDQWITKEKARKSTSNASTKINLSKLRLVTGVLILLAPIAGVAQLFLMPSAPPTPLMQTYDNFSVPRLGEEVLPEDLLGFTRREFSEVDRVPGDPLGQASQQWTYQKGGTSVVVSIDYPYAGIHDLCECYSAIGWGIEDRTVYSAQDIDAQEISEAVGPLAVGQLERELYGHGVLMFNLLDGTGKTSAVIKGIARGAAADRGARRFDSFASDSDTASKKSAAQPPWIQFQLLARLPQQPTANESRELMELFFAARSRLVKLVEEQDPWGGQE